MTWNLNYTWNISHCALECMNVFQGLRSFLGLLCFLEGLRSGVFNSQISLSSSELSISSSSSWGEGYILTNISTLNEFITWFHESWIYEFFFRKGPDHLAPGLGHLGRFLGSTWNRQLKFSAYAWFMIFWSLSKFELI